MINVKLKNQKWCVFGLQGSGKTHFTKYVVRKLFKKPMVYVIHAHDWTNEPVARWKPPKDHDGFVTNLDADFEEFIKQAIKLGKQKKIDCIVIDEADMFFQSNFQIKQRMNDLVLNHRHYNVSVAFISRRPQDIPTKVVESCKAGFYFSLEGDNVIRKLGNIHPELGEMVQQLEHGKHEFVIKEIGKAPRKHAPIVL